MTHREHLEKLKATATASAALLGHRLGKWVDHPDYPEYVSNAECLKCGNGVEVDGPDPEEIQISGSAAFERCLK